MIFGPEAIGGTAAFTSDFVGAATIWIVVAVVVVVNPGHLEGKSVELAGISV